MTRDHHQRRTPSVFWLLLTLSLIAVSIGAGLASAYQAGDDGPSLLEVAPPEMDPPINEAELEDLQTIASQRGISLQAAIERYAWRYRFGLAVDRIREASPAAYARAEIVDAGHAWIAFSGRPPDAALEIIDTFSRSHPGVSVEVRADWGFSAVELQRAIPAVHYAVLKAPGVRDALTSFDSTTGQITTSVVLESTAPDSVLDDLRAVAAQSLTDATRPDILNSITTSVVRSNAQVLSRDESST